MRPHDLIKAARELVAVNQGKPRQANLNRATSTTYYALFHLLARSCADSVVGSDAAKRSNAAWRQVYRALDHRFARDVCGNTKVMSRFPKEIQDFANVFVAMQKKRHAADYDPSTRPRKSEVIADIDTAEAAMEDYAKVPARHRTAFAVWVLLRDRSH